MYRENYTLVQCHIASVSKYEQINGIHSSKSCTVAAKDSNPLSQHQHSCYSCANGLASAEAI